MQEACDETLALCSRSNAGVAFAIFLRVATSGLGIEGLIGKPPVLGVAQLVQARVNGILDHWRGTAHQHQNIVPRRWHEGLDHVLVYESLAVIPF